ncbi:MAG: type II toxin-antitoxin system HipA family toxin [Pseudomonadota bacterium]
MSPAAATTNRPQEQVSVLRLSLHGTVIGHLAGYQGGRTVLVFDPAYVASTQRPTFTLTGLPQHPASATVFAKPWLRQQRLHPVLSNLLPEGALREWLAQQLKVHPDNEFPLFALLSNDLPGALQAHAVKPDEIPEGVLDFRTSVEPVPRAVERPYAHFSLAGVQMKFSVRERDRRYTISAADALGDWIIKTPSTRHTGVPVNEFTAMKLAELAGINIPEIRLVPLTSLDNLPPLNLPQEEHAFAIRRFDRTAAGERVHAEDFAQVLFKYPHEKYGNANAEMLGRIVRGFTSQALANTQQLARRLLVNVLLGNGDAHLKNWSLWYPDQINAELAPAYDILYTQAFVPNEKEQAMNLGGHKDWYTLETSHFEEWSRAVGVPWRVIRPHLLDTLERARTLWPAYLEEAPMLETHKLLLRHHWKSLPKKLQYGL